MKKQLNAKSPIPAQDAGSADAFLHLSLMKAVHHFTSFDEAGITDLLQSDLPICFLHLRLLPTVGQTKINFGKWR